MVAKMDPTEEHLEALNEILETAEVLALDYRGYWSHFRWYAPCPVFVRLVQDIRPWHLETIYRSVCGTLENQQNLVHLFYTLGSKDPEYYDLDGENLAEAIHWISMLLVQYRVLEEPTCLPCAWVGGTQVHAFSVLGCGYPEPPFTMEELLDGILKVRDIMREEALCNQQQS